MTRYEFKDGKSHKFWEIEVDGNRYVVRYGRVGTDGQVQNKSFTSPAKAKAAAEKKTGEKVRKGYKKVAAKKAAKKATGKAKKPATSTKAKKTTKSKRSSAPKEQTDIEAALHDNPDDEDTWAIYADYLQQQGDSRGEVIALEIAKNAATKAKKTKLTKQIAALTEQHQATWAGPALAELLDDEDFDRVVDLEWSKGFITAVRISNPTWDSADVSPSALITAVLKSPASRFLRSLTLGLTESDYPHGVKSGIAATAKSGPLDSLRTLFIGDFDYPGELEISWYHVGKLGRIYAAAPRLEHLHIRGHEIQLGKLEHPTLKSLLIETGGLPKASVRSIANSSLPALERLEVWLGTSEYGGDGSIKHLEPLLYNASPTIKHLGLKNCEWQNAIARALSKAPVLAQLEEVDMSMGTMTDAGANHILVNAQNYQHLRKLDLEHNYISPEMGKALRKALPKIVSIGEQKQDEGDDYYYTTVGE